MEPTFSIPGAQSYAGIGDRSWRMWGLMLEALSSQGPPRGNETDVGWGVSQLGLGMRCAG